MRVISQGDLANMAVQALVLRVLMEEAVVERLASQPYSIGAEDSPHWKTSDRLFLKASCAYPNYYLALNAPVRTE